MSCHLNRVNRPFIRMTLWILVLMQIWPTYARPSMDYMNMSGGDHSTSVDMQGKVVIVSVEKVPDKVVCEKYDPKNGHIQLKAIYKSVEKKVEENKPVIHAADCSSNSNKEPV